MFSINKVVNKHTFARMFQTHVEIWVKHFESSETPDSSSLCTAIASHGLHGQLFTCFYSHKRTHSFLAYSEKTQNKMLQYSLHTVALRCSLLNHRLLDNNIIWEIMGKISECQNVFLQLISFFYWFLKRCFITDINE